MKLIDRPDDLALEIGKRIAQALLLAFGVPALAASAFAGWRWATKK